MLPPLIAVLALLLVAAAFLVSCGRAASPSGSEPGSSGGDDASVADAEKLGPPALGDPNAPVVMVEYGDYQ